jgi:hypothetical protein
VGCLCEVGFVEVVLSLLGFDKRVKEEACGGLCEVEVVVVVRFLGCLCVFGGEGGGGCEVCGVFV